MPNAHVQPFAMRMDVMFEDVDQGLGRRWRRDLGQRNRGDNSALGIACRSDPPRAPLSARAVYRPRQ
jgi:hypothetical protein